MASAGDKKIKPLFGGKGLVFFISSVLLLALSYGVNVLGAVEQGTFHRFQDDSENIVKHTVECNVQRREVIFRGMLIEPSKYNGCDTSQLDPYPSQSGLQGFILSNTALMTELSPSNLFILMSFIVVFLTAVLLALFLTRVLHEFGLPIATLALSLIALATWPVYISHNLYWLFFLHIAPFCYGWVLYPVLRRGKTGWFYLGLGLILLLKFLTGYEYITSIVLSVLAPITYFELKDGNGLRTMLKHLGITLGIGLLAFTASLIVHTTQLSQSKGGYADAITIVLQRASVRTVGGGKLRENCS